uniref:hypothetical protein n=1 Tax=uncultured Sphingomonas sp. TaxID=158754 RepID=UPI003457B380
MNGGTGNDHILGGDCDDILVGGAGDDHLDGGSGIDTVSYRSAPARVSVYLWDDRPQGWGEGQDTLLSIENVEGSSLNDLWSAMPTATNSWVFPATTFWPG